jgi:lysine 2,3-aminomutase
MDRRHLKAWAAVPDSDWSDWRWQIRNAVRSMEQLQTVLGDLPCFSAEQTASISEVTKSYEMKLTPHTVWSIYRAIKAGNRGAAEALLAAFLPSTKELTGDSNGTDGIGEELEFSKPAPLVTNFYKSRVLLFAANTCPSYCRFCFRRRKVGDHLTEDAERGTDPRLLEKAIQYIRDDETIREVIVSGGDPLTLGDDKILGLLRELRSIDHIKVLRIDTKVFTTLPQRITNDFANRLRQVAPIFVIGNFLHPAELTPETLDACARLVDAGICVLAHIALLKGINDDKYVMEELAWELYRHRIIPYYLIQFIPTKWTEHFRVPLSKGLEIMDYLQGRLSGIANPTYIVYLPNGAGKVPILPNYLVKQTEEGYYFRNYEGKTVLYKEALDL